MQTLLLTSKSTEEWKKVWSMSGGCISSFGLFMLLLCVTFTFILFYFHYQNQKKFTYFFLLRKANKKSRKYTCVCACKEELFTFTVFVLYFRIVVIKITHKTNDCKNNCPLINTENKFYESIEIVCSNRLPS